MVRVLDFVQREKKKVRALSSAFYFTLWRQAQTLIRAALSEQDSSVCCSAHGCAQLRLFCLHAAGALQLCSRKGKWHDRLDSGPRANGRPSVRFFFGGLIVQNNVRICNLRGLPKDCAYSSGPVCWIWWKWRFCCLCCLCSSWTIGSRLFCSTVLICLWPTQTRPTTCLWLVPVVDCSMPFPNCRSNLLLVK
ncbi:uncharacterized protein ASCRUDRAFT_106781 [Ascoidea rubescens DSM 1968]|uniref:Uncharacterized protein n=1 Tax=Ascoidea rubescens DSM 1968 TaxID=1344418 RepID=A0A1D2VE52_9ASCO|nr:hypothetical protein ASCRUDRAFT_106781 [Ascoidea rubescens DSM 1968]ODV59773.1 hypothetical protein ASCRUDRAFT_106781 [Ascoidea rubescens DSM 1968]